MEDIGLVLGEQFGEAGDDAEVPGVSRAQGVSQYAVFLQIGGDGAGGGEGGDSDVVAAGGEAAGEVAGDERGAA